MMLQSLGQWKIIVITLDDTVNEGDRAKAAFLI